MSEARKTVEKRSGERRHTGKLRALFCMGVLFLALTGCVNQHPEQSNSRAGGKQQGDSRIQSGAGEVRIAATSPAVMEICEKLDLDLVGVPASSLVEIPERYADATVLGSPMNPDLEILSQLQPDWVLSPASLMSDLQPKYEAAGFRYAFLNLKSVPGMFRSIQEMGTLFGRETRAETLVNEFETYYAAFQERNQGKAKPKVLILMGLPGSYVAATENSYVGSLVALAGGINVYEGTEKEFLNVNTEDMLQKDPDIILRTAHAMPESVMEMFAKEFETNDIWHHFRAVEDGKVYDLPYDKFGMSANFQYQEALETLEQLLYEEE